MMDLFDRFTEWHYRKIRRFVPRSPRAMSIPEMELRFKELQTFGFFLVVTYIAIITDAVMG